MSASAEPLLQGIIHQAWASYLILAGRTQEAGPHLEEAARVFPVGDRTLDRGYLEKWIGAYHLAIGEQEKSAAHFRRAWEVLFRPGLKPEAWLEILFLEGPRSWPRLLAYPGVGTRFHATAREAIGEGPFEFGAARGRLLDLESDLELAQGRVRLGLDLPSRLEALLLIAGERGIPQFRLYEALWPEELFAFAQHQKRIEQAVLRLRAGGVSVSWRASHLTLQRTRARCRWAKPKTTGWSFLNAHERFRRADVEAHFAIPRRTAATLCARWASGGWARAEGSGPSAHYLSNRS